jgi:hypothetical protein
MLISVATFSNVIEGKERMSINTLVSDELPVNSSIFLVNYNWLLVNC